MQHARPADRRITKCPIVPIMTSVASNRSDFMTESGRSPDDIFRTPWVHPGAVVSSAQAGCAGRCAKAENRRQIRDIAAFFAISRAPAIPMRSGTLRAGRNCGLRSLSGRCCAARCARAAVCRGQGRLRALARGGPSKSGRPLRIEPCRGRFIAFQERQTMLVRSRLIVAALAAAGVVLGRRRRWLAWGSRRNGRSGSRNPPRRSWTPSSGSTISCCGSLPPSRCSCWCCS